MFSEVDKAFMTTRRLILSSPLSESEKRSLISDLYLGLATNIAPHITDNQLLADHMLMQIKQVADLACVLIETGGCEERDRIVQIADLRHQL